MTGTRRNDRKSITIKGLLNKREYEDAERYEKGMEDFEKEIKRHTDRLQERLRDQGRELGNWPLLGALDEIRKQLAKIIFSMDRMEYQKRRRREWELYNPPYDVKEEFKKYWKNFMEENFSTIHNALNNAA